MEYFELLNEDGVGSGRLKARDEVHRDGDLHGSVHVWLLRRADDGRMQVLLQKRCDTKDSFPGCLDTSCAGHLDPGEGFLQAAKRELQEELGLSIPEEYLFFLFEQRTEGKFLFHGKAFWNREIQQVYLIDPAYPVKTIRYQESEISGVIWQDSEQVRKELEKKNPAYCIDPEEFDRLLLACRDML